MADTPYKSSSDDSERDVLVTQLGPVLLVRLAALIRTARTYDVSNQAFQNQLQECLGVVNRLMEDESEVALAAVAEHFYLNGVRVRAYASLLSVYHGLMAELERRSIGGIRFLEGVTLPELERFFQIFMAAEDPALAERLEETVHDASIDHILLISAAAIHEEDLQRQLDEPTGSERGRAKRVFWRAVMGSKKLIVRAAQTGRPDLRHAKRLVQPIVDNIMRHEYSIVGLTALKDHDEYTYAHCVNVSILAVSMGHVIGLPRQALADLGVAGLLHDIGKMAVPGEVLRKPAKLTAEEWELVRRHPIEGVKMMIRMPGLSSLAVDSMRACFEHHMGIDGTGYPEVSAAWNQATLSRIIALADCFDAMTAHRAYHARPYTAFEGLRYLLGPNRVQFDRAVLWALIKAVGLYPPGTILGTDSGHTVLALSPNPADLKRPFCRVLINPDGRVEPEEGAATWDPMPAERRVLRVVRPEEIDINVGEMIAA